MLDRGQWACRGTTVVTRNGNQIRIGLRHTSGNSANAWLRDQLYGNLGIWIDLLEVENQLRLIFNRVDIVVWRR